MADAEKAIAFVLSNEGGFVDNPSDSGGATNFGLSLRFLRQIPPDRLRKYGIFTPPDSFAVKSIEQSQAKMIYKGEFWDQALYEKIDNELVANYVLDMAVLHGESQAIKILQRAIWAVFFDKDCVIDDGILGEHTLYSINGMGEENTDNLLCAIMAERAGFCRLLCEINPKNREFLNGWLNRCYRI